MPRRRTHLEYGGVAAPKALARRAFALEARPLPWKLRAADRVQLLVAYRMAALVATILDCSGRQSPVDTMVQRPRAAHVMFRKVRVRGWQGEVSVDIQVPLAAHHLGQLARCVAVDTWAWSCDCSAAVWQLTRLPLNQPQAQSRVRLFVHGQWQATVGD